MLILECLIELFNFSFFSISGWDTHLDYWDTEWFALEMNRDHSVVFEIAPMYTAQLVENPPAMLETWV